MSCYYVIGLRVNHRSANAVNLQQTLTQFGCNIKLRVGLHETSEDYCADDGVILLQVCGDREQIENMVKVFNELQGVTAKLMDLN
jgi:hypothetical protein